MTDQTGHTGEEVVELVEELVVVEWTAEVTVLDVSTDVVDVVCVWTQIQLKMNILSAIHTPQGRPPSTKKTRPCDIVCVRAMFAIQIDLKYLLS